MGKHCGKLSIAANGRDVDGKQAGGDVYMSNDCIDRE